MRILWIVACISFCSIRNSCTCDLRLSIRSPSTCTVPNRMTPPDDGGFDQASDHRLLVMLRDGQPDERDILHDFVDSFFDHFDSLDCISDDIVGCYTLITSISVIKLNIGIPPNHRG